jgi:hypothetical protein
VGLRPRARRADAGAVHLRVGLEQLLLAVHRARPTEPDASVALSLLQSNYFVDYSIVLAGVLLATIPC